jgi:MFS transporter, ACS family, hexuronate transporter
MKNTLSTASPQGIGAYRWTICALLFIATTINYLDRQVIGLLKDILAVEFQWSEKDYSNIVMAFSACYALGYLGFGRIIDTIGTKLGYSISVLFWSGSAVAHALAKSTFGFGIARAGLGLGEGGNFPAAIKAVAEWFPKKERALATGIFNSGTNIAAVIGPLAVAWIYQSFGWRMAFISTGLLGFVWLIFWWIYFEIPKKQKRVSEQEIAFIHSDESADPEKGLPPIRWTSLLFVRQTWAFILGKFLTDPIWWFFLFWVPSYFNTTFGLNLSTSAIHISTVYLAAGIGSVLGGYLPTWFIKKKGWEVYKARKIAMLIYAVLVIPVIGLRFATDIWAAVALISLATAAHQGWSANLFTTVSDMFPRRAVSSVVGIGGMAGSTGGTLFPLLVGFLLDHYKLLGNISLGYNIIFTVCGIAYLVAWTVIQLLAPKMGRVMN